MPKFCVYCGNPVKINDKFCIVCGKPLLTGSSKNTDKMSKDKALKQEKESNRIKEEEPEVIEFIEDEINEEVGEAEEIQEEDLENEKEEKKKKEKIDPSKSLPEDVKHQIDLYIQFTEIEIIKKILNEKLNDVLKATKDPRYEGDFEFKQNTNARLEAIKTLITELKQNESEIKSEMDDIFIIKKLNNSIETKEFQLKNLTREFRLKKMNQETFERLKNKYKGEKIDAESERTELMIGIKLWMQELKTEKAELIGERKLNKGRLSSKELAQEDFKKLDNEFTLKIEKITKKIETLEKLIK